jgi:hypothetical protein
MRCWTWCASGAALLVVGLGACGGELVGPVPVALVLTASDTITVTGATLSLTASAVDSAGAVVAAGPVVWSVADTVRGQVSEQGVFTARDSGRTYVRAQLAAPPLLDSLAVRIVPPGTVKWTWPAPAVDPTGQLPTLGGPALATDGTVYVLVETGGYPDFPATLVALSPAGVVRWTRPLLQVAGSNGVVVTPGTERIWLVGKRLFLITSTGDLLWDSLTAADIPAFLGGAATASVLIAAQGKQLAVYDAVDHGLRWQTPFAPLSDWLVPPTIVGQDRVLAKRTEDTLFVFDVADGDVLRLFLDPDTALDKAVFGTGTVPVADRYYLPTVNRLAAYDTAGPLLWLTEPLARGVTEPAVNPDGTLYIQDRTHGLGALNPDGTTRWYRRPLLPDGNWGTTPRWTWYGGPALAQGGSIYAAGRGAFYAYDAAGTLLWSYVADSAGTWQAFTGAPAIGPDGTVYTWTGTDVYAFWGSAPPEPNSPWPMWRHDAQRTGWAR